MTRSGRSTEELVLEFEDRREIKNLMAKYITSLMLNRDKDLFVQFWSQETDDVCLGLNDGWYVGRDAIADYYAALGARLELIAKLLQKRFPEQLADKTLEEIYGIGPFEAKPVTNPYVVVAADRKTARGVWMVQGADTEVGIYGPLSYWTWGVYACDFTLENGAWKFLHMQYLEDIRHIMGQNWAAKEMLPPELPEFAALKEFRLPEYTIACVNRVLYTPDRKHTPLPELPVQYDTMTPEHSYGVKRG